MNKDDFDYEKHVCELCKHIDSSLDTSAIDAGAIYDSINRFVDKAKDSDIEDEHYQDKMAYNFFLTDQVIHERMNAFSLISLIELLEKNDKIAKALKGHAKNESPRVSWRLFS